MTTSPQPLHSVPRGYPWPPHERRVPHISLVFREMWDSTDVDLKVLRMNQSQRE